MRHVSDMWVSLLKSVKSVKSVARTRLAPFDLTKKKKKTFVVQDAIEDSAELAYLHEAIEPKVVHRDIKSSNILMNDSFDAKLSDFGLAKLLGADKSYVSTRVMGTFGYVAPEYANSGLLNEKSDVYSFGVVLLEAITGRYPVDYERPKEEVHMVEWLKLMVQQKQFEQVVDKELEIKPTTSELKRALLTALRCVDPDADKRPKMSQVARMLESDEYPVMPREERRRRKQPRESTETNKDDTTADAKI
ncbi:hypothetical protein DY000_02050282 [Brassica cretica]|uniref:non-specific serine/threonine protein kinase n=1 Tax=Brassica cretica TaxID=69181 RepID=A0ABQ7ERB6_BRACR|nr:hypothetical protein DY000_02050282 [Brassica cretica]